MAVGGFGLQMTSLSVFGTLNFLPVGIDQPMFHGVVLWL